MPRTNSPKHEEKRQEILAAARKCLLRKGLRGTSIADVCKEAEMSPGHLYYYFASKDEILDAFLAQNLAKDAQALSDLIAQSNIFTAIGTVIEEAKSRNLRAEFLLFLELFAEAGRDPILAKKLRASSHKVWDIMAGFLAKGQEDGFIDHSLRPETTAVILFGILDGIRVMTVRDPAMEMAGVLDHLKIMVGRFLAPPRQ